MNVEENPMNQRKKVLYALITASQRPPKIDRAKHKKKQKKKLNQPSLSSLLKLCKKES